MTSLVSYDVISSNGAEVEFCFVSSFSVVLFGCVEFTCSLNAASVVICWVCCDDAQFDNVKKIRAQKKIEWKILGSDFSIMILDLLLLLVSFNRVTSFYIWNIIIVQLTVLNINIHYLTYRFSTGFKYVISIKLKRLKCQALVLKYKYVTKRQCFETLVKIFLYTLNNTDKKTVWYLKIQRNCFIQNLYFPKNILLKTRGKFYFCLHQIFTLC